MSTLPVRHEFEEFFECVEQKLRTALIAVFGQEAGRDAAAVALAYGWEHWDRISSMGNPVGYLYRVGRSSQRRHKEPAWVEAPQDHTPHFEPGLPSAIAALSEKQRLAVVLVHAYGWDRRETADIVGISVSSIDTHLSRGLSRLRRSLGAETNA
jgi:RNA polymerase sigma-70 factor (ECF subfamily)